MIGYGRIHRTVTCEHCGSEVRFSFAWDRAVGWASFEDTQHQTPAGEPCDLPEGQLQRAIETEP